MVNSPDRSPLRWLPVCGCVLAGIAGASARAVLTVKRSCDSSSVRRPRTRTPLESRELGRRRTLVLSPPSRPRIRGAPPRARARRAARTRIWRRRRACRLNTHAYTTRRLPDSLSLFFLDFDFDSRFRRRFGECTTTLFASSVCFSTNSRSRF